MDNTAADKAVHVHATATVAGAAPPVLPKRFHSFGLSPIKSLCCSTPILLTLVTAPAHSPYSADMSRHSIGYGSCPHLPSSALELRPHLRWDWAGRCHICTGTGRIPATSALVLGLTVATSASGLRSSLQHLPRSSALSHRTQIRPNPQHLCRDWAHPC